MQQSDYKGTVTARVRSGNGRYSIEMIDNGCGLPQENRSRLLEPYMTTRAKGTGLGLAIVQKITEQHGGNVQLRDAARVNGKKGGASVCLDFPLAKPLAGEAPVQAVADGREGGEEREVSSDEQGASHGV